MTRRALAMLGLGVAGVVGVVGVAGCEREPAPVPIVHRDPPPPAVMIVRDAAPAPESPDDQLADIREAALRHMFGNNAAGNKHPAVLCIAVERDADPVPAFLARFDPLPVRPASACDASANGVDDIATHANGLLFHIDRIEWPNAVTAEVSIGYYEGGMSASTNTYWLQRTDGHAGHWVVVAERMNTIS